MFVSRLRKFAIIAGFALVALPASASAVTSSSQTFSYFSIASGSTFQGFLPNGNPFGTDTAGFMAGDTATFTNVLFTGVQGKHSAQPTGHSILNCTFISSDRAICSGQLEVDHSKFEANNVPVSFAGTTTTVPINGGTGKFAGACGSVVATAVGAQGGDTQFTVSISSFNCSAA